jgi:hypothetical protein
VEKVCAQKARLIVYDQDEWLAYVAGVQAQRRDREAKCSTQERPHLQGYSPSFEQRFGDNLGQGRSSIKGFHREDMVVLSSSGKVVGRFVDFVDSWPTFTHRASATCDQDLYFDRIYIASEGPENRLILSKSDNLRRRTIEITGEPGPKPEGPFSSVCTPPDNSNNVESGKPAVTSKAP